MKGVNLSWFVERMGYGRRSSEYFAIQKWLRGQRKTLAMRLRTELADVLQYEGNIRDGQREFRVRR